MEKIIQLFEVAEYHNDLITRLIQAKKHTIIVLNLCPAEGVLLHAQHIGALIMEKRDTLKFLQELTEEVDISSLTTILK